MFLRLVLGHSTKMAALGVIIGVAASLLLTRLMIKMLYGVSPSDPLTFAGVATVLTSWSRSPPAIFLRDAPLALIPSSLYVYE